jgi:hypothetical protein
MKVSSLASLDSLAEIGLRNRIDMRPTLLRVLTDLYIQKPVHTLDEEHRYTELAQRLLDAVDMPTRAAVAARLARHRAPPMRVIRRLAGDLAGFAEPPQPDRALPPAAEAIAPATAAMAGDSNPIRRDVARELNELFFAANAQERRLIVLGLDIVAEVRTEHADDQRNKTIAAQLEAAALARNRERLAQHLAVSLHISREQAHRIAADELGEPIVVAAKALGVPRESLYRILLFINSAVGHSVKRVHALAEIYDEMTLRAAEELVTIWRALKSRERIAGKHQPLLWSDDKQPRPAAALPGKDTTAHGEKYRNAS